MIRTGICFPIKASSLSSDTHSGPAGARRSSWTSTHLRPPATAQPCRSEPAGPPGPAAEAQTRRSAGNRRTQTTLTSALCSPTATGVSSDWPRGHCSRYSGGPPPDQAGQDQDSPEPDQTGMLGRETEITWSLLGSGSPLRP